MARNYTVMAKAGQTTILPLEITHTVIYTREISAPATIERLCADGQWRELLGSGEVMPYHAGEVVLAIRVTAHNSDSKVRLFCTSIPDATPDPRILNGFKAVLTEPFVERNTKLGYQWEAQFRPTQSAGVPAGQSLCLVVTTGSKPVLIKSVFNNFLGADIDGIWYESPTFTGGVTVNIYNPNFRNQQSREVTMLSGVTGGNITVSNFGTQVSPTIGTLGDQSASQNQRAPTSEVLGFERVLAPNTVYLLRIRNNAGSACPMRGYLTWYEGDLSVDMM